MNLIKPGPLTLTLFLLAAAGMLFSSCLRGKGDVICKNIEIPSFTGITNETDAEINLVNGPVQTLEIVAQENIINNISLNVAGQVLTIRFKKKASHYEPIRINITIPEITSLSIPGSGNITLANTFDSCGTVTINISGSGDLDAKIASLTKVYTNISGSGNVSLNGISPEHDITISGSGNVNSFPFHTLRSTVTIPGSGTVQLQTDSTLNVTISGSGNVYYKGHPVITTHITGSGNVYDAN